MRHCWRTGHAISSRTRGQELGQLFVHDVVSPNQAMQRKEKASFHDAQVIHVPSEVKLVPIQ